MRISLGWCGSLTVAALFAAACADTSSGPKAVIVGTVQVLGGVSPLQVGQTVQLTSSVRSTKDSLLGDRPVTWASSAGSVASVTSSGLVTALAVGNTTITATSGGVIGQFLLTVVAVPVAQVTVSPASFTLYAGATRQLVATTRSATGATLDGRVVTWSSLSSSTATVSASGLVTGVSPGATLITATSEGISALSSVTVQIVPVASVLVTPSSDTILVGETATLTAVARDSANNALVGRILTWTTLHPGIASITQNGVVEALAPGNASIEVMSEGKADTASITVTAAPSGWTTGPSMTFPRWHFAFAVVNGVAVAAGGFNNPPPQHRVDVESISLPGGSWATLPGRPSVQTSAAVSVVGSRLYAAGGTNNSFLIDEMWSYEPATGIWRPRAPMPLGARADAVSATINGVIYVAGGRLDPAPTSRLEAFNPATDSAGTWTTRASMPTPRREAGGAELGGLFYVAGGLGVGDVVTGALEAYNPSTDSWTTLAPMPTPRRGFVLASLGGALYAVGGFNGAVLSTVEKYVPGTNSWTTVAPMPTARIGARGIVYNGKLYVLGGYDVANNGMVVMEVFTP